MKWGVLLIAGAMPEDNHQQVLQDSLAYGRAADELGYDEAWVLEHHFTGYGICGSPMTMAAYVLAQTKNLKVGTGISVIPLEHPLRLAEQVALLDNMSNGRFIFGIGRGVFVKDFKVFGVDMENSRDMMDEWVDVMQAAWTNRHSQFDGQFVKFDEIELFPRPLTLPHPPVHVVAQSPSTIEWTAKRGLPMMINFFLDDDAKRTQIDLYNEIAYEHGHDVDNIDHSISCLAGVGDTTQQIVDASRDRLIKWQEEFVRASMIFRKENMNMKGYEWYARQWEQNAIAGEYPVVERVDSNFKINPIGSVQECIDKLNKTVEITGVEHFLCGFESLGGGREQIIESMRRFKEEVIPHVETRRKSDTAQTTSPAENTISEIA